MDARRSSPTTAGTPRRSPDPQDPETFLRSKLDWAEVSDSHARMLGFLPRPDRTAGTANRAMADPWPTHHRRLRRVAGSSCGAARSRSPGLGGGASPSARTPAVLLRFYKTDVADCVDPARPYRAILRPERLCCDGLISPFRGTADYEVREGGHPAIAAVGFTERRPGVPDRDATKRYGHRDGKQQMTGGLKRDRSPAATGGGSSGRRRPPRNLRPGERCATRPARIDRSGRSRTSSQRGQPA